MTNESVRTLFEAIETLLKEEGVRMLRASDLPPIHKGGDTRRVFVGVVSNTLTSALLEIDRVNRNNNQSLAIVIPIGLLKEAPNA